MRQTSQTENAGRSASSEGLPGEGSSLSRAVFGVSALMLCGKVLGFLEKVVIAHFHGTKGTADVYFGVMGIFWAIVFCVKELVYPSVLPVYSGTLADRAQIAGVLFRRVFAAILKVMVVAAVAIALWAPWVTRYLVPGFDRGRQGQAAWLLRSLLVGMTCLALAMVTYTCLNARKKFIVSSAGDVVFRLLVVIGLIGLTTWLGICAVGIAVAVGGVSCLAFHIICLPDRRHLLEVAPAWVASRESRAVRKLMLPLALGVIFSHISGLADNLLASTLPGGQLSGLNYAKKLVDAVVLIGPVALVTIVYSEVSRLNSTRRDAEKAALIHKAGRVLLYLSIPAACFLIELRVPTIRLLFERGQFDADSVAMTAQALGMYACGLVTLSLEGLFVYCFYATADTRTPVVSGVAFVCVDIALAILLMSVYAHVGIAAAFVISKTGKVITLGALLARKIKGIWRAEAWAFLAKLTVC